MIGTDTRLVVDSNGGSYMTYAQPGATWKPEDEPSNLEWTCGYCKRFNATEEHIEECGGCSAGRREDW